MLLPIILEAARDIAIALDRFPCCYVEIIYGSERRFRVHVLTDGVCAFVYPPARSAAMQRCCCHASCSNRRNSSRCGCRNDDGEAWGGGVRAAFQTYLLLYVPQKKIWKLHTPFNTAVVNTSTVTFSYWLSAVPNQLSASMNPLSSILTDSITYYLTMSHPTSHHYF